MTDNPLVTQRSLPELFHYFCKILGPEHKFYTLAIIYGIGISLLSLATPISVQMLVNSIVYTGLATPLVVLSLTLFGLLMIAGLLNALRIHLVDVFGRRFYARMVSQISLRAIYALDPFFDDNNAGSLFNRYFDIIVVMKRIPYLLVGGFSILLQAAVGFLLVSLYHPAFLAFNLIIITMIWVIWLLWGRAAIRSAMAMSHKKHETAAWIEGLASSNGFFKTQRHIDEALERTDRVTAAYMKEHVRHFRHHFAQTLAFLTLYALVSASLLGLGGWLVIRGELTIGQLVAAELVLSVVFVGISQLGTYMTYFYDLCAAIDELSFFDNIEQEELSGIDHRLDGGCGLAFIKARGRVRGRDIVMDFEIPDGSRVLACASSHALQRMFTNFMKRHAVPNSGYITVGGHDTKSINAYALRHEIIVIDRPTVIEMSIREYLRLSADSVSGAAVIKALEIVDLEGAIGQLEEGLDTRLASTGWPLSMTETLRLKLAAVLIAKPRILVIGPIYDVLPGHILRRALDTLQRESKVTVVRFSLRQEACNYDRFLFLGAEHQPLFESLDQFRQHIESRVDEIQDPVTIDNTGAA